MFLQLIYFDYNNLTIKNSVPIKSYSISMDAISNDTSTIIVQKDNLINVGDYIAIKDLNTNSLLYYGQINTVDVNDLDDIVTISSNYIWNLLNGDIIVKNISAKSYEKHIITLIKQYIQSNIKVNPLSLYLKNSTNTEFSVSESDGITTINFIDYIIRGFKLHNVIFDITEIGVGINNGIPFYFPKIDIHQNTMELNIKNNIYDFVNWSVTDSRNIRGYNNELWIVDKNSIDMENPIILKKYWLKKNGSITESINDDVTLPTQVHIYLYDKSLPDNPSYLNIAQSELSGNSYSHNIQFSIPIKNNFISFDDLKLGLQSNIYYNNTVYKSILTGYSFNSDSDLILLNFGNLRFGKKDLFN